jgi:hypothetical protein
MINYTTLRMGTAWLIACLTVLLTSSGAIAQTRPNLGTASTYAIFTGGGAINNTGLSVLTGDVGQDGAYAFNGFPPGIYTGTLNRNNGASAKAKADLITAQTADGLVPCGTVLGVGVVDGQSFVPGVYCSGAATTTSGHITFNAQGNANAIFIVKIGGQLNANAGTHILLANNARAANIYWFVDGAVNVADSSTFVGTIIANGAISFYGKSSLNGRALVAPSGAINISANNMSVSNDTATVANKLIVVHPASGDTLLRKTANYRITWSGSGITPKKTIAYSLDSGVTWKTIATVTIDSFVYNWNVPDTTSTKAFVRVTDTNNLRGVSGRFTIASSKAAANIVLVHPALGDTIVAGATHYQITWTGTGLATQKTVALSLDGGLTWDSIGTISSEGFSYNWNVPDTVSTHAMIRITDARGITGKSGLFTISRKTIVGSMVILHPTAGEVIAGGTTNYQITFTASNTTLKKTLEYSLDGGVTWNLIGLLNSEALSYSWANVPNVATTQALVRITDANGVTGTSGLFTITMTQGVGSINSITLTGLDSKNNIGNSQTLGISWTFTPDIGTSVKVEISLDGMNTWITVANNSIAQPQTSWTTKSTGYYNPVFVRLTSSEGMSLLSTAFSIGSLSSVSSDAARNGYSISNYPNPANEQTTMNFNLPVRSDVTLIVCDNLGRTVSETSQTFDAGRHTIPFNTSQLTSGVYSYTLIAGTTRLTGRMNIVR